MGSPEPRIQIWKCSEGETGDSKLETSYVVENQKVVAELGTHIFHRLYKVLNFRKEPVPKKRGEGK